MLTCSTCEVEKPRHEFVIRADTGKPRRQCRACTNATLRLWATENKERLRAQRYARRVDNIEKARESERAKKSAQRAADPERHRAYFKEYRAANPQRAQEWYERYQAKHGKDRAARQRVYAAVHREQYAEYLKAWRQRNKGKIVEYTQRRKTQKRGAPVADLTADQWQTLQSLFEHRCAYCHGRLERLEQDHVVPLSRGGSHTISNIVPACRTCNARKHRGPFKEMVA